MKEKKKYLIIAASVVLVIVLALIIYFMFLNKTEYKISYDVKGGNFIESVTVGKGEQYSPVLPEKEGFIFAGWLDENGNLVESKIEITEDILLVATWISESATIYEVTFDSNGGSNVDKIIVEEGIELNLPKNPTRSNYTFINWVDSENNVISNGLIVTQNIDLKAIWEKNEVVENDKEEENDVVDLVTKEYYCEDGYELKGTNCYKETKSRVITVDLSTTGNSLYMLKNERLYNTSIKESPTCANDMGRPGTFNEKGGICYYNALENVMDAAECEASHPGAVYYNYGCYEYSKTTNYSCPVGQTEYLYGPAKDRITTCIKEIPRYESKCSAGELITHAVDGEFCLIETIVPAMER